MFLLRNEKVSAVQVKAFLDYEQLINMADVKRRVIALIVDG